MADVVVVVWRLRYAPGVNPTREGPAAPGHKGASINQGTVPVNHAGQSLVLCYVAYLVAAHCYGTTTAPLTPLGVVTRFSCGD